MKTKTIILILTITLTVGVIVWVYQEAKKRRANLPQQIAPVIIPPVVSLGGGGGGGSGGNAPANGFVITGIGQVVTGASPLQSWHTVNVPERVINIQATPVGSYSGTVTINEHTEQLINLNISPSGYPAVYFDPTDTVWGITTAGIYTISIMLNIGGTNYTQTASTEVTNADLGLNGPSGNGFIITGIGQVVTGANPLESWHIVSAPARVINLNATPSGTYPCTVNVNGHTDSFNLNVSPSGYPAVLFNPLTPLWNITTAGTYLVTITLNIAGTVYTRTISTVVTYEDLGIIPPAPSNNQFAILDMHDLKLSHSGFVFSDTTPNTASAFGKNYHSFYLINEDDSNVLSSFTNVDLTAYTGQVVMIRKFMVDATFFPSYASFVANNWQIDENNSANYMLHHSQAFVQL